MSKINIDQIKDDAIEPDWNNYTATHNAFRVSIGDFPVNAQFGHGASGITEAVVGAVNTPAADVTGNHNAGVSGYSRSASPLKGAVGSFGAGTVAADGVSVWGGNFTASNHNGVSPFTNAGKNNTTLYACEVDIGIQKLAGGVEPNVATRGIYIVTSGPGRTINDTNNAIDVHAVDGSFFKRGFYTGDGTVSTFGVDLGTTGSGNGVPSQSIQLRSRSAGAINKVAVIQADLDGNLVLRSGSNSVVSLQDGVGTSLLSAGAGRVVLGGRLKLSTTFTPSSASDAGEQGDLSWDAEYLYICIGPNTWRRIPHATW